MRYTPNDDGSIQVIQEIEIYNTDNTVDSGWMEVKITEEGMSFDCWRRGGNGQEDECIDSCWQTWEDTAAGWFNESVIAVEPQEENAPRPELIDCGRCDWPVGADGFCTKVTCPFHEHAQGCDRGWIGQPDRLVGNPPCTCGGTRRQATARLPACWRDLMERFFPANLAGIRHGEDRNDLRDPEPYYDDERIVSGRFPDGTGWEVAFMSGQANYYGGAHIADEDSDTFIAWPEQITIKGYTLNIEWEE